MKRVWNKWNGWAPGTCDAVRPAVEAPEHIVHESHAIQIRGWLSVKGNLILTTHRFWFLPYRSPTNPNTRRSLWPEIEVVLADIENTSHSKWGDDIWNLYPGFPRLTVTIARAETLTLIVAQYQDWHRQFARLQREQRHPVI
jgi:hypothetical protein